MTLKKNLVVVPDNKLNINHQCEIAAERAALEEALYERYFRVAFLTTLVTADLENYV